MLYELPLELIEPHCGEPQPFFKPLGKIMNFYESSRFKRVIHVHR